MFHRIARPVGTIRLEDLVELIAKRDDLRSVPGRQLVNPFTKELVVDTGAGRALYLDNGKAVGNLSLQEGVALTTGILRGVSEELAALLDAFVHDDDRT